MSKLATLAKVVSASAASGGMYPAMKTGAPASVESPVTALGLAALFERDYDFVWRSLRRLGVVNSGVDDAAQEVFMVASRRLLDMEAGKERAFLFGTAVRVAANYRKKRSQISTDEDLMDRVQHPGPSPAESLERKQARELLDQVLDRIPAGQREVFILFELESMTMIEIASTLAMPAGTVASRLRRARDRFQREVIRLSVQQHAEVCYV